MFTVTEKVHGVAQLQIRGIRSDVHAVAVALILSQSRDASSRFEVRESATRKLTAVWSTGHQLGETP